MSTSSNKKLFRIVLSLLTYSSLSIIITYLAWFAIKPENIFFLPGVNAILGVMSFTALYWKLPNLYFSIVIIYILYIIFIWLLLKGKCKMFFLISLYFGVDIIFSTTLLFVSGGMPAFIMLAVFSLLVDVIVIFQLVLLKHDNQGKDKGKNQSGDGTVISQSGDGSLIDAGN